MCPYVFRSLMGLQGPRINGQRLWGGVIPWRGASTRLTARRLKVDDYARQNGFLAVFILKHVWGFDSHYWISVLTL